MYMSLHWNWKSHFDFAEAVATTTNAIRPEIEKFISKWLRNASDREGGRKAQQLAHQQNDERYLIYKQ